MEEVPKRESGMNGFEKPEGKLGRAPDDQALKLTVAFYCIMEPEHRAEILALAERRARGSARIDGVTHYLDLDPTAKGRH